VSSDGAFAVVACEAEAPEADECDAEASTLDAPGSIFIVELLAGPERARVAAVVTGTALYEMGLQHEPARAGSDREIEPEFVAIAPRGKFALVTLQEQSAVAVVDLRPLRSAAPEEKRSGVEAAGARCLAGVVLLTQSGRDEKGHVRGACPDGIAISPDASLAVTADEAGPKAREMQGLTFLDLRDGSANVRVASRHSLFDLDPALEPVPARTRNRLRPPKKVVKAGARKRLPRLDPEGVAFARHGDRLILAVAIERSAPGEEAGSVLFLDATGVLDGEPPRRIDRKLVGLTLGARPETLEFTPDGAMVFVACERDGGTITSIGIDGP
jgi:DNA-binding beta-propeller fold protein YncE